MPKKKSMMPPKVEEHWFGACLDFPGYVMEDKPFRPQMLIWLDATHDQVVGHHLLDPGQPRSLLADILVSATQRPMEGAPRMPAQVRVATTQDVEAIRSRFGDAIALSVGPMEQMDALAEIMRREMTQSPQERAQTIRDEDFDTGVLHRFYAATAELWKAAPWRMLSDDELIQLHCPSLGVNNWVISIIGALGESFGAMCFPSMQAFDAFRRYAIKAQKGRKPDKLLTSVFVINFDRGAEVPKAMRERIAKHKFPVADANGYPSIAMPDTDLILRPVVENDYLIATACAEVMAQFFTKHKTAIKKGTLQSTTLTVELKSLPGKPSITLKGPHPERPWAQPCQLGCHSRVSAL